MSPTLGHQPTGQSDSSDDVRYAEKIIGFRKVSNTASMFHSNAGLDIKVATTSPAAKICASPAVDLVSNSCLLSFLILVWLLFHRVHGPTPCRDYNAALSREVRRC